MSSDWQGETGVIVTRYCGPDRGPEIRRTRFQLNANGLHIDLNADQAIELSILLIKATHQYRGEHD